MSLEWSLEVLELAREARLYNTFVTNGYMTEIALRLFTAPPAPVTTLERAQEIGLQAGLRHVYLGNIPGHPGEHTLCPNCGAILVKRGMLRLLHCDVTADRCCSHCGQGIAGSGWGWMKHA